MTEVAVREQSAGALALRADQNRFDAQQLAALHQMGVENAPEGDLAVFLNQCQRTGLDPFLRQIYMIGRKSRGETKYTIQTSIDGLRVIAERSRDYAGQTEPQWAGEDGVWRSLWLRKWGTPAAARIGVYRRSWGDRPVYGVAMFDEYAQTKYDGGLTQMWADKGSLMLAKCAESLALRKAFPQDLSGLYTAEEMSQADVPTTREYAAAPDRERAPQVEAAQPAPAAETPELVRIKQLYSELKLQPSDLGEIVAAFPGDAKRVSELPQHLQAGVVEVLEKKLAERDAKPAEEPNPFLDGVESKSEVVDGEAED